MNAEELVSQYAAGERDFPGIRLSGVVFGKAKLREINLNGADLSGARVGVSTFWSCSIRNRD